MFQVVLAIPYNHLLFTIRENNTYATALTPGAKRYQQRNISFCHADQAQGEREAKIPCPNYVSESGLYLQKTSVHDWEFVMLVITLGEQNGHCHRKYLGT